MNKKNPNLLDKEIKYIVIHCSATRENCVYSAEQLELDHLKRGFSSAGYHFYIRRSGQVITMRMLSDRGAHCYGYNHCSIGVCYEGGLSESGNYKDTRTIPQKRALLELLKKLCKAYPTAEVVGHRDLSPDLNNDGFIDKWEWIKACPCFDARQEYAHINKSLSVQY